MSQLLAEGLVYFGVSIPELGLDIVRGRVSKVFEDQLLASKTVFVGSYQRRQNWGTGSLLLQKGSQIHGGGILFATLMEFAFYKFRPPVRMSAAPHA